MTQKFKRGCLTDEVKKLSKDLFGYEISREELRLMPYVFTRLLDNVRIERERISREENRILNEWERKKFIHIESDVKGRRVFSTVLFYEAMSKILMVGYAKGMLC